MRWRKARRVTGLVILGIGRLLARFLPIGGLSVAHWLYKQFSFNGVSVPYSLGHTVIVIPGVASCWRDVVLGREYAVWEFLSGWASEATGFLDWGANIGYFSCLVARLNRKAKVVAVEPLPECRSYLRAVRRINKLTNIDIIGAVLSDHDGVCEFELPQERYGESGGLGRASVVTHVIQVQGYSLDSLLQKFFAEDRVVVKVDIEGFESVALRVPVSPENAPKVIALCVEVHLYCFAQPQAEFADLLAALQGWFPADWFIAKPRCLQSSWRRYWDRVRRREAVMPLDADLVSSLIESKQVEELHLFGVRRSL